MLTGQFFENPARQSTKGKDGYVYGPWDPLTWTEEAFDMSIDFKFR